MKRFKNILVVYKHVIGDNDTLSQATALAKQNNARVTLVDVIDSSANHSGAAIAERKKHLTRLAASIHEDGIKVDAIVLEGIPFLEIIQQVLRGEHDLVMITAEGRGVVREFFFGNTAMRLFRKCPCAVWVVNPRGRISYDRILTAVAPMRDDEEGRNLNFKIMELATSQARIHSSEIHLVHAWEVTGPDLEILNNEPAVLDPEGTNEKILQRHELMHKKSVEKLLENYDLTGIKLHIHLQRGSPGTIVPKVSDENQIDLIIMGTVVRTGIPGFLIGNTAETILRLVNCAVMTVKPDGFVSPVTL